MNTYKLYIGRLNVVTKVNYHSGDDLEINSIFKKYVLVHKNRYKYRDIITGNKYSGFNVLLKKDDKFIDQDYLESFNKKYDNKKKYLSKKKIIKIMKQKEEDL